VPDLCDTAVVLILVRHGRTQANREGRLQGRLDQDLDDHGRRQALAVAAYVQERCEVDHVVSSPLRRAEQTATAFGRPIEIDERWMELAYGQYEGTPQADVPSEVWSRWRLDPHFTPEGGESLANLDVRVRAACSDLLLRAATSNIVVVSHVSPMKSAVAWALGVGVDISFNCHLDHASVCRIAIRGDRPVLQTFNETAPLTETITTPIS
jgi:alpha-ribazole phosphatase